MEIDVIQNSFNYWEERYHKLNKFTTDYGEWLDNYTDIIDQVKTPIIDLGCGDGNDSYYLANKGKKVIACDQSEKAIVNVKHNVEKIWDTKCFNMLEKFPFEDNCTELIIADLSLHYFKEEDTFRILKEIKRILKPNGHLIFRVNSMEDKNFGAGDGKEVEKHLYLCDGRVLKRFFDEQDIEYFFRDFTIESMKEDTVLKFNSIKNETLEKKMYQVCVKNR